MPTGSLDSIPSLRRLSNRLIGGRGTDRFQGKVFGVGLNKTGTKSLEAAVRILGFRTGNTGKESSALMQKALDEDLPILHYCPKRISLADAFFDCRPIERNFEAVDRHYPGSKFILHTRDVDDWLDSREKHVRRNQEAAERGTYTGPWLDVDRKAWADEWTQNHEAVRSYFAGRSDFLEIDIAAGDGWDILAPFLECPDPGVPMPWRNTAAQEPSLRAQGGLDSALDRLRSIVRRP